MGTYLIPGCNSTSEAADYNAAPGRVWTPVPGGVQVMSKAESDAQLAAAYAGFTPSGVDEFAYVPPLPQPVRDAVALLKQIEAAGWPTPTLAQQGQLNRAIFDLLRFLNQRLNE